MHFDLARICTGGLRPAVTLIPCQSLSFVGSSSAPQYTGCISSSPQTSQHQSEVKPFMEIVDHDNFYLFLQKYLAILLMTHAALSAQNPGMVIVKVLPDPGSLSSVILPP